MPNKIAKIQIPQGTFESKNQSDSKDSANDAIKSPKKYSDRNLHIEGVPLEWSVDNLTKHFMNLGRIVKSNIPKNQFTGQSQGYGFVEFSTQAEAENAKNAMDGTLVEKNKLKVTFAIAKSKVKPKNLQWNVLASGLPQTMTTAELEKMFSPFGKISTSRLSNDQSRKGTKNARIKFQFLNDALKAIEELNGKELPGADKPILVQPVMQEQKKKIIKKGRDFDHGFGRGFDQPPYAIQSYGMPYSQGRGMNGGWGRHYYYDDYDDYWGGYGRGRGSYGDAWGAEYSHNGSWTSTGYDYQVRPYGRFNWNSHLSHGTGYGDRRAPPFSTSRRRNDKRDAMDQPASQGASLFIFGILPDVKEEDLYDLFKLYGKVVKAVIIRNKSSSTSRGYGFVHLDQFRDAQRAIEDLNGKKCGGKILRVILKRGRPKEYTYADPPAELIRPHGEINGDSPKIEVGNED